ncbi:rCG63274 [Rattus norvegicus]|uniref:RCG63274 n=1 Tax=Rattus norvegicus TaxID=10116 RepID=A6K7F9_RAT|nr:rCG63274 [Rattus norvegicus]
MEKLFKISGRNITLLIWKSGFSLHSHHQSTETMKYKKY